MKEWKPNKRKIERERDVPCDEETVDVVRGDEEGWVLVDDAVQVDQRQNVALVTAVAVLHDALQVLPHRDGGRLSLVEPCDELVPWVVRQPIPFSCEPVQQTEHHVRKLLRLETEYVRTLSLLGVPPGPRVQQLRRDLTLDPGLSSSSSPHSLPLHLMLHRCPSVLCR